jgi:F-type H+-transporting ATPase subunit b
MDKRTAKFKAQKDEASSLLNDARTQHQHSQELVQQAAVKAANVVAESAGQAQAQADAIIAEAKAKAQSIVEQAKADSLQIRQQNQAAMQTQAVQLAVEIASKILEREVSTQDHQNIIDKFLTKVK